MKQTLNARLKHCFFRFYLLIATLVLLAAVFCFLRTGKGRDEITLLITVVGSVFTALYFTQKQKLEELHLFKELFTDFNCRYDVMNGDLNNIMENQNKDLTLEEKTLLNDYFNLCAEEFLFFRQGYIYLEVWVAWHNGMRFFLDNDDRIKKYWELEKKSESYYGLQI